MRYFTLLLTFLVAFWATGSAFGQRTGNFQLFDRSANSPNILQNISNPVSRIDSPMSVTGMQMEQISKTMDDIVQKAFEPIIEQNTAPAPGTAAANGAIDFMSSAIEGQLVVEDPSAVVNPVVLPPIDGNTSMYTPRLMLEAGDFQQPADMEVRERKQLAMLLKQCEERFELKGRIKLVPSRSLVGSKSRTVLLLQGTVDFPHQSRMIELLAQMSPGVDTVRNELDVIPSLNPAR